MTDTKGVPGAEVLAPSALLSERCRTHELKCWPEPYDAIVAGVKRFEYRRDDRGFAVGDILRLRKWDPSAGIGGYYFREPDSNIGDPGCYPSIDVRVTYILVGRHGVPDGFVVMSIEHAEPTRRGGVKESPSTAPLKGEARGGR